MKTNESSASDKHGLSFVQNHIVIGGGLRFAVLGCFFLILLLFAQQKELYSVFFLHLTLTLSLSSILGFVDGKRRYASLLNDLDRYNRLGYRYQKLRLNVFIHKTDIKFDRDVLLLLWETGQIKFVVLTVGLIFLTALSPWFLVRVMSFKNFQFAFHPFVLTIVAFGTYRFARLVYWRLRISPMIKRDFGYDFQTLYRVTERR